MTRQRMVRRSSRGPASLSGAPQLRRRRTAGVTPEALLPWLPPRLQIALLARALSRHGYDEPLAGHIVVDLGDGTALATPALLGWNEVTDKQVLRIDRDGDVLEGDWPPPPDIALGLGRARSQPYAWVMHNSPPYGKLWAHTVHEPTATPVPGVLLLPTNGVLVSGCSAGEIYERAVSYEDRCRLTWELRGAGAPGLPGLSAIADLPLPPPRRGLWEWAARTEMEYLPGSSAAVMAIG